MRAGDNDGGGSLCPKCGEDVLDREGNGNLIDSIHNAIMRQAARQLGSPYEPSTYLDGDDLDLPRPDEEPDEHFDYTAEGWMRERDEEAALYAQQELLDGVEDDESHTDEQEEVERAWLEEQEAAVAAAWATVVSESLPVKAERIKEYFNLPSELYVDAVIREANVLIELTPDGLTLTEQADRLLDEIERVRHLTQFGP